MASRPAVLGALIITWTVLGMTGTASADPLASFRAGSVDILLMTNPCGAHAGNLQKALRTSAQGQQAGCWNVNARGNPVVKWSDGVSQELPESQLVLAPRYAALLKDIDRTTAAPSDPHPTAEFPRPDWCRSARFPHEKLVCNDPRLAANDLDLGPLWRAYRERLRLNHVEQASQRAHYFRRLLACGADPACVAREQTTQMRIYRDALSRATPTTDRRD